MTKADTIFKENIERILKDGVFSEQARPKYKDGTVANSKYVTGVAGTVAALAGAVYAFKKKVIEPEEQKAAFIEENRKKAARRRVSR